ncbi:MAG: hypothetical protein WCP16_21270 [Pseudanabaena sp. ELA645]
MTKERSGGLPKTSGQTKVGRPNETTDSDELQGTPTTRSPSSH